MEVYRHAVSGFHVREFLGLRSQLFSSKSSLMPCLIQGLVLKYVAYLMAHYSRYSNDV